MHSHRVLQVAAVGGTAWFLLLPQAKAAREAGYDVAFAFSPGSSSAEKLRAEGFEVFEAPISRRINPRKDCAGWRELRRIIADYQPSIVHTHTSKGGAIGRLAARHFPNVHVIHTIHGFPFIAGQSMLTYWQYVFIEWLLARTSTDLLLSQSQEDVSAAGKYAIRARQGAPRWIGNGINLSTFSSECVRPNESLRSEHNLSSDTVIFVTVARVTLEKGLGEMVEALSALRDRNWHWFVIGGADDTGFAERVRQRIAQVELDGMVTFLGFRNDIPELLSQADWFVLPSHREGVPRSLIEAQAMNLPAIATDIRGCREVIEVGVTGMLVRPRDASALHLALHEALSIDRTKHDEMGLKARARALELFDEQAVCRRILSVYSELLGTTTKRMAAQ